MCFHMLSFTHLALKIHSGFGALFKKNTNVPDGQDEPGQKLFKGKKKKTLNDTGAIKKYICVHMSAFIF